MLIDTCAIARGEILRAQIAQQTAEWEAAGNKIEEVQNSPGVAVLPFQISERSAARTQTKRPPRKPRKPRSKRKDAQADLAALARRMLEGGFV